MSEEMTQRQMLEEIHQFCTELARTISSAGKNPMMRMVPGMGDVVKAAGNTEIGKRAARG